MSPDIKRRYLDASVNVLKCLLANSATVLAVLQLVASPPVHASKRAKAITLTTCLVCMWGKTVIPRSFNLNK